MHPYRCYFLNEADRIVNVEIGSCRDDAQAHDWGMALLRKRPRYPAVEIWDLERKVGRHVRDERVVPSSEVSLNR
jgi:hypothetical protein